MREGLQIAGWLACAVYSTIPLFWMMIHPFAARWRARRRSPYRVLLPAWIAMWAAMAAITSPFRNVALYRTDWAWIPAGFLFTLGLFIYSRSGKKFSAKQLGGVPEVHGGYREERLVTEGIRARVRHPVYLAHLCEMLAWSIGTGLAVCWGLTAFAMVSGAAMVAMEDVELEQRFREDFRSYKAKVPAVIPLINGGYSVAVLATSISLVIAASGFLVFAVARKNQPMLFQHGTPEVPGGSAFAIMNPFRNQISEQTAERLIRDLRTEKCEQIVQSLHSEMSMCAILHDNHRASLIWREDTESARLLVYDLPDIQSRLCVALRRGESGFEVDRVSLIR